MDQEVSIMSRSRTRTGHDYGSLFRPIAKHKTCNFILNNQSMTEPLFQGGTYRWLAFFRTGLKHCHVGYIKSPGILDFEESQYQHQTNHHTNRQTNRQTTCYYSSARINNQLATFTNFNVLSEWRHQCLQHQTRSKRRYLPLVPWPNWQTT